jgi:hypothetical protein
MNESGETAPLPARAAAAGAVSEDRLRGAAHSIEWRADDYERHGSPTPHTIRELRKDAAVVRAAAAVVDAARAFRHGDGPDDEEAHWRALRAAVDAYEAVLTA